MVKLLAVVIQRVGQAGHRGQRGPLQLAERDSTHLHRQPRGRLRRREIAPHQLIRRALTTLDLTASQYLYTNRFNSIPIRFHL